MLTRNGDVGILGSHRLDRIRRVRDLLKRRGELIDGIIQVVGNPDTCPVEADANRPISDRDCTSGCASFRRERDHIVINTVDNPDISAIEGDTIRGCPDAHCALPSLPARTTLPYRPSYL